MRELLTIQFSALEFLLTNLQEEKYPGIEASNHLRFSRKYIYKEQKKQALRDYFE